ncbi:MAG: hypothetical protein C4574_02775 [Candidatus Latescibacterota bacterium]|jgi:anti-sigma factor RsiW|nr:MAG: hypothetical protein C4574_02775 [Candidatus Latescibacterota bacterium]
MDVTRNVILDLLPLYASGEASADTRALVEKHLATDPEAADIASELAKLQSVSDVPAPLNREDAMEAYREAKKYMLQRTIALAIIIAVTFIATISFLGLILSRAFHLF